jgi:hypothetical protein
MSDYYDSAKGVKISQKRAFQELRFHGVKSRKKFLMDLGDHPRYWATDVLEWLGY